VVNYPYCGFEGELGLTKTWKFRFYNVKMLQRSGCSGVFNHYYGISSRTVRYLSSLLGLVQELENQQNDERE
jgi:hypothetical protein